jgi:hypothetical protein
MKARTHANTLKVMIAVGIIGVFLSVCLLGGISTAAELQFLCGSLEVFVVLWLLVLLLLPVRCAQPECQGRMRRRIGPAPDYPLQYQCDRCGAIYEDPEISFGPGEPWR